MAGRKFTEEERKRGNQFETGGSRAVECGKKGQEALRRNQSIAKRRKEMFALLAGAETTEKNAEAVRKSLGLEEDDVVTNDDVMTMSVYQLALKGDSRAREQYYQMTTEEKSEEVKEYKLPADVIGQAFTKINRHIFPNKSYVFKGGRGGLKSSYISLKIVELIKNNPTMHACVVRKVASTLKDSVYAQISWAINTLGLEEEFDFKKSPLEITYKKTGQVIFFRGADDPIKLKSIKAPLDI